MNIAIAEMAERMEVEAPAGIEACNRPTFYESENFRGKRFALGMSVPKLSKVTVDGTRMWTRVSSLCVPKGWTVSLFDGDDYKGRAHHLRGPAVIDDLGRVKRDNGYYTDMDNKARSIRINRNVSAQQTAQKVQVQ